MSRSLGATVVPILDPGRRLRLERLVDRAMEIQDQDLRVRMEERAWTGHSAVDGMIDPAGVAWGEGHTRRRRTRFDHEAEDPPLRETTSRCDRSEPTDGLLVVVTADDGRLSWLHAGEALSAVWLDATTEGLSVVPLSQVVEVAETRHRARGPARDQACIHRSCSVSDGRRSVAATCTARLGDPWTTSSGRSTGLGPTPLRLTGRRWEVGGNERKQDEGPHNARRQVRPSSTATWRRCAASSSSPGGPRACTTRNPGGGGSTGGCSSFVPIARVS